MEVDKRYVTELSNHAKIEELKKAGKTEEAHEMEEATTYHFDHGYGLDCYKVGPTLGCGAPALLSGEEMVYLIVIRHIKYWIMDLCALQSSLITTHFL